MIHKYVYILFSLFLVILYNSIFAKPVTSYGIGMDRDKALSNALKNAVEMQISKIIPPRKFTNNYRKIDSLFRCNYHQYILNQIITGSTQEFNLCKLWITCDILQEKLIDSLVYKKIIPRIETKPKYTVIFEKNSSLTPSLKMYTLRKIEEICLKNGYTLVDMEQLKILASQRRSDTLIYPKIEDAAFVYGIDFLLKVNVNLSDIGEKKIYGKEFYSINGETSINIVKCDNAEILSSNIASKRIESRDKVSLPQRVITENINSISNRMIEDIESFWHNELYQCKDIELVIKNCDVPSVTLLEKILNKNPNIISLNLRYMEKDLYMFDLKMLGTMQDLRNYLTTGNDTTFSLLALNVNRIFIQPGKNKLPVIAHQKKPYLEITSFKIDTIYASSVDYYATHESAHITLQSNGRNISDVKVSVIIPGIMNAPSEMKISGLLEKQDVSLCLVLAKDSLQKINNSEFVMSRVDISYSIDGHKEIKTLNSPVMIHNITSINWENPRSVASFVVKNDKSIRSVSRELSKVIPDSTVSTPVSIRNAIVVFEYLRLRGSKYVSDPVHGGLKRVDKIKYPGQTLSDLSGDCDDFSVLYAAMLSSIGINTGIVIYQDHVNVIFDTGISEDRYEKICLKKSDIVVHEHGNIWIPVEVTKFDEGFFSAWKTATKMYNKTLKLGENIEIIDVSKAWETYPPASFRFESVQFKKPAGLNESTLRELKKITRILHAEIDDKIAGFRNKSILTHRDLNELAFLYMKKNDPGNARVNLQNVNSDDLDIGIENNLVITHILAGEFNKAENILNRNYTKDSTGTIAVNKALLYYIKYIEGIGDLHSFTQAYEEACNINPFAIDMLKSLNISYSQVKIDPENILSHKELKKRTEYSFPLSFQLVDLDQRKSKILSNKFSKSVIEFDRSESVYFAATGSETSTGSIGNKGIIKSGSSTDENSLHIYELFFWFKF